MQKNGFADAVDRILAEDPRYHREAYAFVRDALDFTVKHQKKSKEGMPRHVTPTQLLDGMRLYALKEFGPMVLTVFNYWDIRSCEDLGNIVFNMIRTEILGKNETDTLDQFKNGYDFHEAFVVPYTPEPPAQKPPASAPAAATEPGK